MNAPPKVAGKGQQRGKGQGKGQGKGSDRPEWRCATCQTGNWLDRGRCRACGKGKAVAKAAASAGGGTEAKKAATDDNKEAPTETDATETRGSGRPMAPEERAAKAAARAFALETSASGLCAAGLSENAAVLETGQRDSARAAPRHRRANAWTP